MSDPQIIGSGKPHSVSIEPGSNSATRKTRRKPDTTAVEVPTLRTQATLEAATPAPKAPRAAAARAPRKGAARLPPPPPAEAPPPPPMLGDGILRRIAELQQRNEAVRAQLDRLPAAARASLQE